MARSTAGTGTRRKGFGQGAAAVRRILEEWTADWRAEYVPPPGLEPGLGPRQVIPRYIREDVLLTGLADAVLFAARGVMRVGADLRTLLRRGNGDARFPDTRAHPSGTERTPLPLHPAARRVSMSPEELRAARFAQERRKICRRSTTARCPTPAEIRAAWTAVRDAPASRLRLGRLLMDLECYVDNDLIVRWYRKLPKIVGRQPGIRGWIAENCPELAPKYKTLMRHKSLATRARQESGAIDPRPLEPPVLHDAPPAENAPRGDGTKERAPFRTSVRIQARRRGTDLPRRHRYAWEHGFLRIDANGRFFLTNENYSRAVRSVEGMADVSDAARPHGYNSQTPPCPGAPRPQANLRIIPWAPRRGHAGEGEARAER